MKQKHFVTKGVDEHSHFLSMQGYIAPKYVYIHPE